MKKILLADDDFFIRDLYKIVFSKTPQYELQMAVDGGETMEKIKNTVYDLILLDIMMPKYSGIEILKFLRSLQPPVNQTPVYIITNLSQQSVHDEVSNIGIEGFILKADLTPMQVLEVVTKYFDEKQKALPET